LRWVAGLLLSDVADVRAVFIEVQGVLEQGHERETGGDI